MSRTRRAAPLPSVAPDDPRLAWPIDLLEPTQRGLRACQALGVVTVGDFAGRPRDDFLALRDCGPRTYSDLLRRVRRCLSRAAAAPAFASGAWTDRTEMGHPCAREYGGKMTETASTGGATQSDDAAQRTDEIEHIRLAVAQLCAKYGEDYWLEMDRTHGYPTEFVEELTQAGFLGVLIPEQYGGSGLGVLEAAAVMEEVCRSGAHAGV